MSENKKGESIKMIFMKVQGDDNIHVFIRGKNWKSRINKINKSEIIRSEIKTMKRDDIRLWIVRIGSIERITGKRYCKRCVERIYNQIMGY